ncbi:MAG TPA: hypothetical protein VFR86_24435 [Burkholderiaceae bacterium]|nr:hypothetical protein [Burkholderiaceae bacterium]
MRTPLSRNAARIIAVTATVWGLTVSVEPLIEGSETPPVEQRDAESSDADSQQIGRSVTVVSKEGATGSADQAKPQRDS